MSKIKDYFKIYESEETKEVFEQSEYAANRLSAVVIFWCAAILLISWILNTLGVFTVAKSRMNILAISGLIEFAIPIVLYFLYNGKNRWLKYVMVITLTFACTQLFAILNHNVILIMVLPVLLSSRYFSKGFTFMISFISVILLAAASALSVVYGIIDLNFFPRLENGTVITIVSSLRASVESLGIDNKKAIISTLVNGYIPRLLVFTIISYIAIYIAKYGHDMILSQDEISRASASVKSELNTATQIQNGMVPNIFPAFPGRKEFDIHAAMFTAKEVGGDFYDFFLVDEKRLAIVIADVSGKGVPAALFMMASKILINDRTLMGGTPSEILKFVNDRICTNNKAEMFVTVWLGILNLETGEVIAANAGHEYPAICRNGKGFDLLKDKHGFVIGGMEGVNYKDYEFKLEKGDALFLYTDGIPEATNNSKEQFGTQRMIEALNIDENAPANDILKNVKTKVDEFVGDATQFDDITMLCIRYNGKNQ